MLAGEVRGGGVRACLEFEATPRTAMRGAWWVRERHALSTQGVHSNGVHCALGGGHHKQLEEGGGGVVCAAGLQQRWIRGENLLRSIGAGRDGAGVATSQLGVVRAHK